MAEANCRIASLQGPNMADFRGGRGTAVVSETHYDCAAELRTSHQPTIRQLTPDQMRGFLIEIWNGHPLLQQLYTAHALPPERLHTTLMAILQDWQLETGKAVEVVEDGAVQRCGGQGRATLRATVDGEGHRVEKGQRLLIERSLLNDADALLEEIKWELAAYYAGTLWDQAPRIEGSTPGAFNQAQFWLAQYITFGADEGSGRLLEYFG